MHEIWSTDDLFRLQKEFVYSSDDKLLVDFVGRFENLESDFGLITDRLGILRDYKSR